MSETPNAPLAAPRPAATVMLLREQGSAVEVLVTRRHEKLAFMGGMWVFPGGTLAPADSSDQVLARIPGPAQARYAKFATLQGDAVEPRQCLGLAVAAYRETFEETGVLLASTADGHPCSAELVAQLQERRRAITAEPALFAQMLVDADLHLNVDQLVYWAHWITPSAGARRFDTRFFILRVPADQTALIDTTETIDYAWMTPQSLVTSARAGTMPISHPTLYNLMELQACLSARGSLFDLLTGEKQRRVVPILPKLIEDGTVMVLPWDPFYRKVVGESAPEDLEYSPLVRALPARMLQRR